MRGKPLLRTPTSVMSLSHASALQSSALGSEGESAHTLYAAIHQKERANGQERSKVRAFNLTVSPVRELTPNSVVVLLALVVCWDRAAAWQLYVVRMTAWGLGCEKGSWG